MQDHKGHHIYGWFTHNQKLWYQSEAKKIRNGVMVEVGVYGGCSLLSIIETCNQNGTKLFGIDPWEKFKTMSGIVNQNEKFWRDNFKTRRLQLETIIKKLNYEATLLQTSSSEANLQFEDKSLDFVFIDADHSYESVYNDLTIWFPKIKKGQIIAGHDLGWKTVKDAVESFCEHNKIKYMSPVGNVWKITV